MLCILTRLPYGISEAGRQWQKFIKGWPLDKEGFVRVFGVSQIFIKRNNTGEVTMLVAEITDAILKGGGLGQREDFAEHVKGIFDVRKVIIDGAVHFNWCRLSKNVEGEVNCRWWSVYIYEIHTPNPHYTVTKKASRRTMNRK